MINTFFGSRDREDMGKKTCRNNSHQKYDLSRYHATYISINLGTRRIISGKLPVAFVDSKSNKICNFNVYQR